MLRLKIVEALTYILIVLNDDGNDGTGINAAQPASDSTKKNNQTSPR